MNVIVPVRGRWANVQRFAKAFRAADPVENGLRLVVACSGTAQEVCTIMGVLYLV